MTNEEIGILKAECTRIENNYEELMRRLKFDKKEIL